MIEKQPTIYKIPTVYKQAGGGGVVPVPDGFKQLLWVSPDCDENSIRYNEAAYIDIGPHYNNYKWVFDFIDLSKIKAWYQNNNIGTSSTYFLVISNGKTRYLGFRLDSNDIQFQYFAQGYYSGNYITKNDLSIETIIIDKINAKISGITVPNGGGAISSGIGQQTYVFGQGTSIPPIKYGSLKIYDVQDNLIEDWRPVERLGGGDNRYGYYDVINNVFKASIRSGRYLVGGPEIV